MKRSDVTSNGMKHAYETEENMDEWNEIHDFGVAPNVVEIKKDKITATMPLA